MKVLVAKQEQIEQAVERLLKPYIIIDNGNLYDFYRDIRAAERKIRTLGWEKVTDAEIVQAAFEEILPAYTVGDDTDRGFLKADLLALIEGKGGG